MTTPRAHAELAKLYYSDKEMQCWEWDKVMRTWRAAPFPWFSDEKNYHVGKTAPTEPPQVMCELAGVKFPMPAQEPLKVGEGYFFMDFHYPEIPNKDTWDDHEVDRRRLKSGAVQLSEEGAIKQAHALHAAIRQAIEKAKEQIK